MLHARSIHNKNSDCSDRTIGQYIYISYKSATQHQAGSAFASADPQLEATTAQFLGSLKCIVAIFLKNDAQFSSGGITNILVVNISLDSSI